MSITKFKRFDEITPEECVAMKDSFLEYAKGLPDRIIDHIRLMESDEEYMKEGFNITRLQHCLQTATRAYRAGKDAEYVVCALMHDVGDLLAPHNHGELAAAMLKPFVSEANYFMVKHHGCFEGYHYYHKQGRNRNERLKHEHSPYFEHTREFADEIEMISFDEQYDTLPLEFFIPMIRQVFVMPHLRPKT